MPVNLIVRLLGPFVLVRRDVDANSVFLYIYSFYFASAESFTESSKGCMTSKQPEQRLNISVKTVHIASTSNPY